MQLAAAKPVGAGTSPWKHSALICVSYVLLPASMLLPWEKSREENSSQLQDGFC